MNFGAQLEEYTRILKRIKKRLSEEHSGALVPALVWWKLMIKKQEYEIAQNKSTRKQIASKVTRAVAHRA